MIESLKNTIAAFDSEERKLLLYKLRSLAAEDDSGTGDKPKRLVAYVKPLQDLQMDSLQAYLKERLPAYMIPTTILAIDEIPHLPNGKIDKVALSKLRHKTEDKDVDQSQQSSEIEKKLIAIWEQVLDFSPVLPNDNFFEIGGDSILSIQIVAKARNAGIILSPNQLFENQTIAELALFAKSEEEEEEGVPLETIEGEVALTPIQHWFFETHKTAPHFWNQIMEVTHLPEMAPANLESVIKHLIAHHDALRLSFQQIDGEWSADVLNKEDIIAFQIIDLSETKDTQQQKDEIRERLNAIQSAGDLGKGGLFKCIYFECGDIQENKTYLLAHHLVVDMVSWNILLTDISYLIDLVLKQQAVVLKKKITNIKAWGDQLSELLNSPEILNELSYWQSQKIDHKKFPADFDNSTGVYEAHSIETLKLALNEQDTSFLMGNANDLYNTKPEDLIISALALTICNWSQQNQFCFGMEKHGRTAECLSIDVSNTVGWFTSYFPISLEHMVQGDLGDQIKSVKEELRNVPNNGIGYGVLRYLSKDSVYRDQLDHQPQLVFNYLGNQTKMKEEGKIAFVPISEGTRHPLSEQTYGMEINTFAVCGQLHINWSFSTELYKENTVKDLAKAFEDCIKDIIQYCQNKDSGEYTPSDFPEANISQEDLDNLLKGI